VSASLPGCAVADDATHTLADTSEARLAAALNFRLNQSCPPGVPMSIQKHAQRPLSATDGIAAKSPVRENPLLRRR